MKASDEDQCRKKAPVPLLIAIATAAIIVTACTSTNKKDTNQQTASTSSAVSSTTELFGINGESIFMREAPGEKSRKLINEKATEALGEMHYCEVDNSVKVEILEIKDDWAKVKVVEPAWLSASHIGWIPSKYLISKQDEEKQELKSLDPKEYEIMKTGHNQAIQNFHVVLKRSDFDKNYVYQFVKQFRKEHCTMNCNIFVYDTKSILPLVDIYPLEPNDYIRLADHFISMSTFDATEVRDWYPYQDFKYKEYNGKTWKKEPVK